MRSGNGQAVAWWTALERAGVDPEADVATLRGKVERLGLLYSTSARVCEPVATNYAVVWAGGWPRDPEAPFGEATSDGSPSHALAEALGRFLVKDPGYPLR
jgi:hypothetical protein